jgi:hypothetical protein
MPKHAVTLNKIDIHNTSCILTCELLLLTCIKFSELFYQPNEAHNPAHKVQLFTLSLKENVNLWSLINSFFLLLASVANRRNLIVTAICGYRTKLHATSEMQ